MAFIDHQFGISFTAQGVAELPRVRVDSDIDPSYDRNADVTVNAGGNLQQALDQVRPGQIVELEAGATFNATYRLRDKGAIDNRWIYIRSTRWRELPPPGTRVGPSQSHLMPKIKTWAVNQPCLLSDHRAHHYRLIGIEFHSDKNDNNQVVQVGEDNANLYESSVDQLPHHWVFDRVLVHGTTSNQIQGGIDLKGTHLAVVDSSIYEIHYLGKDSQALLAWNTPGPLKIVNNHLEAAGENVMFGGSGPRIPGIVPSDIEMRGNLLFKPMSWKVSPAIFTIKNLFEIKNAQRVLFEGNHLQNCWRHGQDGDAIVLTPRNQAGWQPQCTCRDVTIRNNRIDNCDGNVFDVLNGDNKFETAHSRNIVFENNLATNIRSRCWMIASIWSWQNSPPGSLIPPVENLHIKHNTFLLAPGAASLCWVETRRPAVDGYVVKDNILSHGNYGYLWSPSAETWDTMHDREDFRNNVIIGGNQRIPAGNFTNVQMAQVGFRDPANGDYSLFPSSPYAGKATDGGDIGASM